MSRMIRASEVTSPPSSASTRSRNGWARAMRNHWTSDSPGPLATAVSKEAST
jgi:hypothetical protein